MQIHLKGLELLTHTEIYDAIHNHGKTTVLIFNGGTEQRGPHELAFGEYCFLHSLHNFVHLLIPFIPWLAKLNV